MKLTDDQMRQAWSRFTTAQIKRLKPDTSADGERVAAGRARILAIREADEAERLKP